MELTINIYISVLHQHIYCTAGHYSALYRLVYQFIALPVQIGGALSGAGFWIADVIS